MKKFQNLLLIIYNKKLKMPLIKIYNKFINIINYLIRIISHQNFNIISEFVLFRRFVFT